jgi:outer membrane protein TolC
MAFRSPRRPLLVAARIAAAVATALTPLAATADETPLAPLAPPRAIDTVPPLRAFTMGQALAFARAHQPQIREALARVSARIDEAKVPSAQWLPSIGVTAQIFAMTSNNTTATYLPPSSVDIPRIGGTAATTTGTWQPYASTLVGVGITQEVFDFGRIEAQRAAADARVAVERHNADAQRLDVDFGVEEAYFAVSAAKAVVRASDEAYERSSVHRDLAKHNVDAGLRSPIELTRAEADLTLFDVGRIKARGGLAVSQSVLSAAMGAPDPAVDIAGEPVALRDMPALPEAVALARQRDPRLAATLAELKAAEARTRAIGAEMRPDIALSGTLTGRAGGAPPASQQAPTGEGWVPDVPNWDVGLILSWPLFDGTVNARRNAARTAEDVRRSDVDVLTEEDLARVRQAYVEVQVANDALTALNRAVVAARANYEQANARFNSGIGNAVELADAESVRANAEIQLALGQFEVGRARAAFGRAIAEGL